MEKQFRKQLGSKARVYQSSVRRDDNSQFPIDILHRDTQLSRQLGRLSMSEQQPPTSPTETFRTSATSPIQRSTTRTDPNPGDNDAPKNNDAPTFSTPSRPTVKRSRSQISDTSGVQASSMGSPVAAVSQLFSRPTFRRSSSLFESLPARSSVPRLSQNSTLLDNDFQSNTAFQSETDTKDTPQPPSQAGKSTFFGAVMRLGSKVTSSTNAVLPSTPTNRKQSSSGDPSATSPGDTKSQGFMSPSGNTIMNIVNQFVMNSPFRFHTPKAKQRLRSGSYSSTSRSPHQRKRPRIDSLSGKVLEDSMSSLHDDDNWLEAPLHNSQAEILDWSLKTKLRLECHPSNALHTLMANAEWKNALRYWVYPPNVSDSSLPALQKRKSLSATGKKRSYDGSKEEQSSHIPEKDMDAPTDTTIELASKLVRSVKGPTAHIGRQGPESKTIDPAQARKREWQDAFRSLYLNWINKMEDLAESNLSAATLDCYFYAASDDHVVLFRVDQPTRSNAKCTPRVHITGCSEEFLQDLRHYGANSVVEIKDRNEAGSILEDHAKAGLPMSPTVKADLEALRKAQAYGEIAGADVSIKFQAKRGSQMTFPEAPKQRKVSATTSGLDNVACFFEVYMNKFGRVRDDSPPKLPQLLCGYSELGPFLHSSLKSLDVYPLKQPPKPSPDGDAVVEIEGNVLPGTLRRLMGVASGKLTAHCSAQPNQEASLTIRSPIKDPNASGSHYFVLHTINAPGTPRYPSTVLFNSLGQTIPEVEEVLPNAVQECVARKELQLVVWDISRDNVIACKMGAPVKQ